MNTEKRLDEIEAELKAFDEEFETDLSAMSEEEKRELDRWARSWFAFASHITSQPFEAFAYWASAHPATLMLCTRLSFDELYALDRFPTPALRVELSFLNGLLMNNRLSEEEAEQRLTDLRERFVAPALREWQAQQQRQSAGDPDAGLAA